MIADQFKSYSEMTTSLRKVKEYLSNLQQHHHSDVFDIRDLVTIKQADINNLYEADVGN